MRTQSTHPYVFGGRHSVEWYDQSAPQVVLGTGDRFLIECRGGPCTSRLEIFPPRLEIGERDGLYVLHDDGPRAMVLRLRGSQTVTSSDAPVPREAPPELRVPRPQESAPADEMTMARAWLVHLRESAILKLEGLDDEQLRWKPAPTANSLGAIVVHLGYAERLWLRVIFDGEQMDMTWRARMFEFPNGWSAGDVIAFYRAETAAADAVLDGADSFDLPSRGEIRPTTLRWVVVHLIEEIARHAGHMDITRELLDGTTGR